MIELGYVLTYRAAWSVSVASVVVNGMIDIAQGTPAHPCCAT